MKKKALKCQCQRVACGAFTLLELLIAVTIFSVIAVTLYTSFYTGVKILRKSSEVMELNQDIRMAAADMGTDLRNCLLYPLHENGKGEIGPGKKEKDIYFFFGERKRFSFVTLKDVSTQAGGAEREVCDITYYFDGSGDGRLMRSIMRQGSGYASGIDNENLVLTGVSDIEILYSYEASEENGEPVWLDIWKQEESVPLGVKVKLTLKRPGPLKNITETVFIPVGSLGILEEAHEP